MGWIVFASALAGFLVLHSVPLRPPVRPWLVARLGPAGFGIACSALSLALLWALFLAARHAPYVALWAEPPHVAWLVLGLAGAILAFGLGRPNPLSFGGTRNAVFVPGKAGLLGWMRHPVLLALALWAAAHIVPNGDLAHVILFGTFAVFALLGGRLIDRRKRREIGAEWQRLRLAVAEAPPLSARASNGTFTRLVAGAVLYATLLWLHPVLFGVSPLP